MTGSARDRRRTRRVMSRFARGLLIVSNVARRAAYAIELLGRRVRGACTRCGQPVLSTGQYCHDCLRFGSLLAARRGPRHARLVEDVTRLNRKIADDSQWPEEKS